MQARDKTNSYMFSDDLAPPQVLAEFFLALHPAYGQVVGNGRNPTLSRHKAYQAGQARSSDVQLLLSKIRAGIKKLTHAPADGPVSLSEGMLQGQRYIASNRFFVKDGKEAAFEKRWATRKSRLAELPGFRFFVMLRRSDPVPDEPNYISFTVWENKDYFTAWRKGEAFKEAHGGGSLFGFVDMMVSSTKTLKGAPKPAFYDGLLPIAPPVDNMPESVDGWRNVFADGINKLDTEVFIAQNRFSITPGNEVAFEQRWQQRQSKLRECDGFVSFYMMRRDAPKADDGYNYISATVWRDRAAFDAWRASQTASHGQGASADKPPAKSHSSGDRKPPSVGMMKGPPSVALYDGILSLYAPDYNEKASKEVVA